MSIDPLEIAIWTRAWAISRDCAPAAPAFGGWFVHVGEPDQQSRYVFAMLNPIRLRALGAAIREPHVLLKFPTNAGAVQAALGHNWDAVRTGWFMRADLIDADPEPPAGFTITGDGGTCRQYRMAGPGGEEAARARLTVIGAHAIIDSLDTEPAFRRRGLASALMSRLAADARSAGANVGLLTSTDAGLQVYERLGWTVLAPWTTAQLKGRAVEGVGVSIWNEDTVDLTRFDRIGADTMPGFLGIEFLARGDDWVKARMPVNARTHQPFGRLHGGASVAFAETVASMAGAMTVDPATHGVVGQEINANHIRPVRDGYVYATAKAEAIGRTSQVWTIRIESEAGKLVCLSRITLAVIATDRA